MNVSMVTLVNSVKSAKMDFTTTSQQGVASPVTAVLKEVLTLLVITQEGVTVKREQQA